MVHTLWIHVTCLSPMPSMRWPPKPTLWRVGTLYGLEGHDPDVGVRGAEALPRGDRPRGAHRRDERPDLERERVRGRLRRGRGAVEVEAVVPHLLELVEDPVPRHGAQLADLVVDLLDVRLAPRRRDHVRPVAADLLEALLAHLLGQDHERAVPHPRPHPRSPDPEVPGGREDERLVAGRARAVELLLDEDRVGRPDLVGSRRELAAGEDDDRGADAGEGLGQDGERHRAVGLPREVPQVEGIERAGSGPRAPSPAGREGRAPGPSSRRTSARRS